MECTLSNTILFLTFNVSRINNVWVDVVVTFDKVSNPVESNIALIFKFGETRSTLYFLQNHSVLTSSTDLVINVFKKTPVSFWLHLIQNEIVNLLKAKD